MEPNQRTRGRPFPRRRAFFILIAALAATVLLLQTWHTAHRPQGNDLTCYLLASRALLHGGDPYRIASPFPFVYPLLLPLALAPLTLVPYDAAVALWFAANLVCLIAALRLWRRLAGDPGPWRSAALLALQWPILASNFLNGQVNYPVLLLLLWGLSALGRGSAAGAAAGFAPAIAIKVAPAVVLLHPALRRRRRALGLTLVGATALAALPFLAAGPRLPGLYAGYARRVLLAPILDPALPLADRVFFGLPGLSVRLLGPTGPAHVAGVAGSLLVLAVAVAAGARARRGPRADLAVFNLLLVTMLLAGPKSETHHLAFAMPAVFTLGAEGRRGRRVAVAWLPILALALGGLWPAGPVYLVGVAGLWLCLLARTADPSNANDS
jgi:alpha-1,2-mannosyltransferase